jgi:hypothetical protein
MLNEGSQIHNFTLCLITLVIPFYYGSGSIMVGSATAKSYGAGSATLFSSVQTCWQESKRILRCVVTSQSVRANFPGVQFWHISKK